MKRSSYIGGFFARADHDRFVLPLALQANASQFDSYFPHAWRQKRRVLCETGIDTLASIIQEMQSSPTSWSGHLWVPENFCAASLNRLNKKMPLIQYRRYQSHAQLSQTQACDAVLFLHFNGYQPEIEIQIQQLKSSHSIIAIEDFVHAPLDMQRATGDYAFASLRKFTSADVAITYLTEESELDTQPSVYHKLKKRAEELKSTFYTAPSQALEASYLETNVAAEKSLDAAEFIVAAQAPEIQRLLHFDFVRCQAIRRENYAQLEKRLANLAALEVHTGDYMYFILSLASNSRRDELKQGLMREGIFPVIHWADSGSPIAQRSLSLHIDQRYHLDDMERVADTICTILEKLLKI